LRKSLDERVIKNFCQEYVQGKTPNPCVRCNEYLKFGLLLKRALSLEAEYLATGHYARVTSRCKPNSLKKIFCLQKALDRYKDQSYFLYRLSQAQLKKALFPLGDYTKPEVRRLADNLGIPVAKKPASQEICFLSGNDYRAFLNSKKVRIKPGLIVDGQGKVLGRHKGIAYYTIGQRQGLGIAKGLPLYVTKIDPVSNQITLGKREDCLKREFLVKDLHFILTPSKKKIAARVKIRYNHPEAQAEILLFKSRARVYFKEDQFAITPGQSAVFYHKDTVLGGGIIEEALR
jgi:tRNA-specific 2-thiouridylase